MANIAADGGTLGGWMHKARGYGRAMCNVFEDYEMNQFEELKSTLEGIGTNFEKFKTANDARFAELLEFKAGVEEEQAVRKMPGRNDRGETAGLIAGLDRPEIWRDIKSGEMYPVLGHKDRLSALSPNKTGVSFGRWARGVLTGKYADDVKQLNDEAKALATSPDASGGYTVPEPLAREFIDLLRSKLVISLAGARLVPMTSKTLTMAKLLADASVAWHAENATVDASDPTFGAVTLTAKTVVGLVKFSVELSEDSINVEEVITRSLSAAVAAAIDRAGLANTTANGPSGILSFTGRQRVTGVGSLTSYDPWLDAMGDLLTADVPIESIGASIMGPHTWTSLSKLKTGLTNDKTSLVKPAALANTPFLVTSSVQDSGGSPGGIAYMADWRDLLYGLRTDIQIRLLREAFLGSNLQIAALVYMRCDFAAARDASFCTIEDIV